MTRHCVMSTLCEDGWDSVFCLGCREELYFWKDYLIYLNSRHCFESKDTSLLILFIRTLVPLEVVHSLTLTMTLCVTENENLQSSTCRELSVIQFSSHSFASLVEGSHVRWFTDRASSC